MKKPIIGFCLALLLGCSPTTESIKEQPILKVSVYQSGEVQIDGNNVSLVELHAQFTDLKSNNGAVWYYRESGKEESLLISMELISIIIKYEIPILLSSEPDFSDVGNNMVQSEPG